MKQVLYFLSRQPVQDKLYYVSYFFDYDVTMILRQLAMDSPDEARELFNRENYLWYKHYGLKYIPKKRFTVKQWTPDNSIKAVSVHDVQGFFQCSFINALTKFNIGTEKQRKTIADMKQQRGNFDFTMAKEIISYSELECKLLAKLVDKLRVYAENVGITPAPYEGPGPMAAHAYMQFFGSTRYKAQQRTIPAAVSSMAAKSYYGGRFEICAHGPINQTVYQYDINSAYPASLLQLPCLEHGLWKKGRHSNLFLAKISWKYCARKKFGAAMPFPVRTKEGSIYYPQSGTGWYWSPEILLAEQSGFKITYHSVYSYIKHCECQPFKWVEQIYCERKRMDKINPGSGIPLKLVLNTLYGKMVQTRPTIGKWFNMVWGSLVTSFTRARVYETYLSGVRVLMFATDAVFTLDKLDNKYIGPELGQFGYEGKYNDLTIFQPGIYFSKNEAKFKTRGIPKAEFQKHAQELKDISLTWNKYFDVSLQNHLSMRLGLHFGHDWINQIGNWIRIEKRLSASPVLKRQIAQKKIDGIVYTKPYIGDVMTVPWSIKIRDKIDGDKRLDDYFLEVVYEGEL